MSGIAVGQLRLSGTLTTSMKVNAPQLPRKKIYLLKCPRESPDLNPTRRYQGVTKKVLHTGHPANVSELEQFWKEE